MTITCGGADREKFLELLERAGFRIRGSRADCPYCDGHSRLTTSIGADTWHCHRCGRKGGINSLSREFGVTVTPESAERRRGRQRRAEFHEWREFLCWIFIKRLWLLQRKASLAKQLLAVYPELDAAWKFLADFCDEERILVGALELLSFDKTPRYLEFPMTRDRLFAAFEECNATARCA